MNAKDKGVTPAWRRMISPLRYWRVKHSAKRSFDYGWPLVLTVVTVGLFMFLPVRPAILGEQGFVKGLHDLIGLLAAFFVAALAAVSTVERKALDAPMIGTPPTLDGLPLSRRQFVCMLFGYLSVLAFVLYLASILAEILAPSLRATLSAGHLGNRADHLRHRLCLRILEHGHDDYVRYLVPNREGANVSSRWKRGSRRATDNPAKVAASEGKG